LDFSGTCSRVRYEMMCERAAQRIPAALDNCSVKRDTRCRVPEWNTNKNVNHSDVGGWGGSLPHSAF